MPKFLEEKLKKEYAGKDESIPYKIMNRLGFMRGNKETAKGRAADAKHARDKGTSVKGASTAQKEAEDMNKAEEYSEVKDDQVFDKKHKDKDEKFHKASKLGNTLKAKMISKLHERKG